MYGFNDAPSLANLWGFASLIAFAATTLPKNLIVVFPILKKMNFLKQLLQNARALGLTCFACSLVHSYLILQRRHLDWSSSTFTSSFEGITCFIALLFMSLTSNDYSVRILHKWWKVLQHHLTYYVVLFLLCFHIIAKKTGWSWITPWGIIIIFATAFFFLARKWIEYQQSQAK